ncbi:MAG: hypothetical protein IAF38_09680 [Bacteroidia bacterium]|nr:hypothetical protein [Bacteroidia bacterium]
MSEEKSSKAEKFIEYFTAILLGLTTTFGALAAYYNSKWSGSSNENFVKSTISTSEASAGLLTSLNLSIIHRMDAITDDIYYTEWKRNYREKDPDTSYFFSMMSPERQTDLVKGTPDLAETEVYKKQKADGDSVQLMLASCDSMFKVSENQMKVAQTEGGTGDDFTLITVLYTIVLFFAGFSSLKISGRLKLIYIVCAVLVFGVTTFMFFQLPFPK